MKHYILKIVPVIGLIFATSCTSTQYVSIDVLQPAKIDFADNIVNIGIVDNAGAVLSDSTTADIIHLPEEVITSKGKDVFLRSLEQFMNEEKYFGQVILYPQAMRTDKNYGIQLPLMKSTIQNIAQKMDVDAIVSLEVFETKNGETLVDGGGWLFTAAQANTKIMFRIYDSSGTARSPIMLTTDSVTWMGDSGTKYDMRPYQELALQLSEGVSRQLIPSWETQERFYYTDGTKLMKTANKHVAKKEWAEAAKVWGAVFEAETDNARKAKAAVNIALANENLDDINNAVQWIKIASNTMAGNTNNDLYRYISWYKVKLLERQQDNPKLLDQLGVEE